MDIISIRKSQIQYIQYNECEKKQPFEYSILVNLKEGEFKLLNLQYMSKESFISERRSCMQQLIDESISNSYTNEDFLTIKCNI